MNTGNRVKTGWGSRRVISDKAILSKANGGGTRGMAVKNRGPSERWTLFVL
jgi:hypothetical protein